MTTIPDDDARRGVEPTSATRVRVRGREWISFAGCGYLGLGHHPDVIAAATRGLSTSGFGIAASRVTSGGHPSHRRLEAAIAGFLGTDDAAVLPDGYLADLAAVAAIAGHVERVAIDADAHPSLWDAATHRRSCPRRGMSHPRVGHPSVSGVVDGST